MLGVEQGERHKEHKCLRDNRFVLFVAFSLLKAKTSTRHSCSPLVIFSSDQHPSNLFEKKLQCAMRNISSYEASKLVGKKCQGVC